MNAERLQELIVKIDTKSATADDKLEYLQLLHDDGRIPLKQLEMYKKGKNTELILKCAVVMGGALLITLMLENLYIDTEN